MARRTLRPTSIGASAGIAIFLAACSGSLADPDATPGPVGGATPIPTASPLAAVPAPTILDTGGNRGNGGTGEEPSPDVAYIVVAGDTLSRIAAEFGTTVSALIDANELTSEDILIGQQLLIPGASGGTVPTPTPTRPTGVQTYVVQPGDTGFGIALQFDTTLEALAAANGLAVDDLSRLSIGQELLIPGS